MKKVILILTITLCMVIAQLIIISCHTPPSKYAENGGQDSTKSTEKNSPDIAQFRQQASDSIEANRKWLEKFDKALSKDSRETRQFYEKEMDTLKRQNEILKKDITGYEDKGEKKWDSFRTRFNQSLQELSRSIRNLNDTIGK
jgi:hypothetical protein